jgi:hypothetical protein
VCGLRALAGAAQAFNDVLGRNTVMVDNPDAAPSQADKAAEIPPRTAPDRAAHARAVRLRSTRTVSICVV